MSEAYWNYFYEGSQKNELNTDDWLEKHMSYVTYSKDIPIIDLGCGIGNNTLRLLDMGYQVISCDFSMKAIEMLNEFDTRVQSSCFNMLEGLPFEMRSVRLVIADLSLHYFTLADTYNLLNDIERVLEKDGVLLCRLNSLYDTNFGAKDGVEIEPHYYESQGKRKRFFDEEDIDQIFVNWEILYKKQIQIDRYTKPKMAWELALKALAD